MGLYRKILPCFIGFRCTERDAETLAHLAQVSGLDKSAVLASVSTAGPGGGVAALGVPRPGGGHRDAHLSAS